MSALAPLPEPPSEPAVLLRLSTPGDVVEALPYLFGFHPEESLVAVSLRGPRSRLGLRLRVDLPAAASEGELAELVAGHLVHDGADEAVLVVYSEEPAAQPRLLRRSLVDDVRARLVRAGVELRDALVVSRGRWWSYLCAAPDCCPVDGTALRPTHGSTSEVAATATYAGLAPLPTRADLVASLRPVGSLAQAAAEQALEWAAHSLLDRLAAGESGEALRAEHRALLQAALAGAGELALPDDVTARLVLALRDVPLRDEVCGWATGPRGERLRLVLEHLVRRALPPDDAPVTTVLAAVAYQQGDGAVAGIALERALASDPGYRLALLLDEALARGVPPSGVREGVLGSPAPAGRQRRGRPGGRARRRG